ncbi:N-acetylglucosamine kinase [Micropruina sp.]|uniref:N-acetylglucosamine kinase n=1 Tax=Micropruina sp. TaxID=2737536 RepID=UPI0039E29A81
MTDSTAGVLALDCGQTSLTWSLVDHDGEQTGSAKGVDTSRPIEPQLAEAVRAILTLTGQNPSVVACGSSGMDRPDAEAVLDGLGGTSVRQVLLAHDSTTSYLGALGNTEGVMIASGTGVVTLAVGRDEVARVDGWGWIMGDAGSAFWIGRNALEAAMRGYDGRRAATVLTDVVAADFDDIELAYLELQADPDRVARVASYAAKVDRVAGSDPVARDILDRAAAHLAEAVGSAAHRVGLGRDEPPLVCALGQTFSSARLLDRFVSYLTMEWPSFALLEARGNGLTGATLLPTVTGSALASRVVRASH